MFEKFNLASAHVDDHVANGKGKHVAIFYRNHATTYEKLLELTNRAGNILKNRFAVEPENRVLLALKDSPELIYFFLSAMKIGAVPIVINPQSRPESLEYYLNDSRAKIVVFDNTSAPKINEVKNRLAFTKEFLSTQIDEFQTLMRESSRTLVAMNTSKDDVAYWVYTSGTTGKPKAAVHLHHDLMYSVPSYARYVLSASEKDIFYSTSKLCFSYGRVNSMHMPLMLGASVVLDSEKPDPERVVKIIDEFKVSLFFSVPTFYNTLIRYHEGTKGKKSWKGGESLRHCISAGENLPATTYRNWKALTNKEILDGLGSSEAEYIFVTNFPGKSRPGSLGQLVPGWEAKVVQKDGSGIEIGVGKKRTKQSSELIGNLWVKSDSIAAQYWRRHSDSKDTFVGDWYNTHDVVRVDWQGRFYYVGRSDDLFKVRGMWVSPHDIEDIVLSAPSVLECAVVSERDDSGMDRPRAFVRLRNDVDTNVAISQIQELCNKKLLPHQRPYSILRVSEIPKTQTGKIQRYILRAAEQE